MIVPNRRHLPRRNTEVAIQIIIVPAYSKERENNCKLIPAKVVNQSDEGLCLETDLALQPGSNITIKMDAPGERIHSKEAYYMHDGRIIWCQKIDGETARFGIGVKILRKAVQADILTSRFGSSSVESHRE